MRNLHANFRRDIDDLHDSLDRPAFRTIPYERVSGAGIRALSVALGFDRATTTQFVAWATRVQKSSVLADGTPLIVDEHGLPHLAANKHLSACRTRGNKPPTIAKKAYDVVQFLRAVYVDDEVEYETLNGSRYLEHYSKLLSQVTNGHGVVSQAAVIEKKCWHVAEFLQFAAAFEDRPELAPMTERKVTSRLGWGGVMSSLRPLAEETLRRDLLAVPRATSLWEDRKRWAVAIPSEEIPRVVEQGGTVPKWLRSRNEQWPPRMMRFGLAVNIGFLTGARLDETVSLTVADIEKAYSALVQMREFEDREQCIGVFTTRTKGSRSRRMLCFHPVLLDKCHEYILFERAEIVRNSRKSNTDHDYLFVNHSHDRANRGLPLTGSTLTREFSKAVIAANFTTTISGPDPMDDTTISKQRPTYTFHSLRRTIANIVNEALGLTAAAVFLGHSSVNTTETHYIDSSGAFASALPDIILPVDEPPARMMN